MAARKDSEKAAQPQEQPSAEKSAALRSDVGPSQAGGVGEKDEFVNPAQDELQKTVEEAEDKGFLGTEVDETPNENYGVEGVTSGKPTPETERGQV